MTTRQAYREAKKRYGPRAKAWKSSRYGGVIYFVCGTSDEDLIADETIPFGMGYSYEGAFDQADRNLIWIRNQHKTKTIRMKDRKVA